MKKLLPRDPDSIGGFQLVGRLGSGGLGVVYLAHRVGVSVALKVMREALVDEPSERERFRREIELLSKVDSPNVARIIDSGVDGETAWFATDFVNGPNLKEYLAAHGTLPEEDWFAFAEGLFRGLADIHGQGIVHRDIKPANIILENGSPKIIDFGISQMAEATSLTATGVMAGSPAWFAPEQIDGKEVTPATDLFAAGSVLTYAATGRTPWGDPDTMTRASALRIGDGPGDLTGLTTGQVKLVEPLTAPAPQNRMVNWHAMRSGRVEVPEKRESLPVAANPEDSKSESLDTITADGRLNRPDEVTNASGFTMEHRERRGIKARKWKGSAYSLLAAALGGIIFIAIPSSTVGNDPNLDYSMPLSGQPASPLSSGRPAPSAGQSSSTAEQPLSQEERLGVEDYLLDGISGVSVWAWEDGEFTVVGGRLATERPMPDSVKGLVSVGWDASDIAGFLPTGCYPNADFDVERYSFQYVCDAFDPRWKEAPGQISFWVHGGDLGREARVEVELLAGTLEPSTYLDSDVSAPLGEPVEGQCLHNC